MKRKLSPDLVAARSVKKTLPETTKNDTNSCPLIGILRQYGLLETIVSVLTSDDLLALALASKATHQAIFPRPSSSENLLGRLSCSGKGIEIRNRCHKKSKFFYEYNCIEHVQCGSSNIRRRVESRPCVSCKVNTCDECRIHCVYQSIYEAPSDLSDPAELPNFSGFVLLDSFEQPILSPHHLDTQDATELQRWHNPSTSDAGPYHDQGYLDIALEVDAAAAPECIKDVIDLDLGQHSLAALSADSRYWGSPSPVLKSFSNAAEARKAFLCESCFSRDAPKGPGALHPPMDRLPWLQRLSGGAPIQPCHCSLRKRFLDRWLCLRCYEHEDLTIRACTALAPMGWTGLCRCHLNARHILCLWCWGKVTENGEVAHEMDTDGTRSSP